MADLQVMLNVLSAEWRRGRTAYHLTLGKLVEGLSAVDSELPVTFDVGGSPDHPHSYRGYYSDLSFERGSAPVTAATMLAVAKGALGNTFEGYKGGDYVMGADTPLWCAPYGCCGLAIVGMEVTDDGVVLTTKDVDTPQ